MSQSPLMEVKDLRVWYNSYRGYAKVLDGVDLHIHRGEKIGLVGEAGCGKTTTMKALMHLLPERTAKIPTGELSLEGQALNPMPEKERAALLRRHISMVFQEPASALNPVFTIGAHMVDVVRSAEAAKGVRLSKKEGLERAAEALAQVLIPDPARILTCYPNQLSGGMKQRVCIAMAVMAQRDLLIADEPGTALDVSIQAKVINMLMRFRREREMTYLFITHDLSLMRNIADRIVISGVTFVRDAGGTDAGVRAALAPPALSRGAVCGRVGGPQGGKTGDGPCGRRRGRDLGAGGGGPFSGARCLHDGGTGVPDGPEGNLSGAHPDGLSASGGPGRCPGLAAATPAGPQRQEAGGAAGPVGAHGP